MIKRRISQVISLVILHSSWGPEVKWLCNPVLSCHSCALAWFACPIGVFIHYAGWHLFPFMAIGMVLLVGVLVGRMLCGWVCPFGFLLDMLYKIPSPKFHLPAWTGYIKYVVLAAMVLVLPFLLGESTMYSFCRVCPASGIQVTIPNIVMRGWATVGLINALKLAVLVVVIVLAIFSSRSFCKMFCPIAAILGPLNYISFWAMNLPTTHASCVECGKCNTVCPSDGQPLSRIEREVSPNRTDDCIVCHDCQKACPVRAKSA